MRSAYETVRTWLLTGLTPEQRELGAESLEWLVLVSVLVSLLTILMGLLERDLPGTVSMTIQSLVNAVMQCTSC